MGTTNYIFLKFSLKALPSGERFSYQEALDDHQKKHNNFYQCRVDPWYERRQLPLALISRLELIILFSNKTFSTPSNRCKHEEKHGKEKHGKAVEEIEDGFEHESPIE